MFTYTRHYRRDPARQVPPLGVGDHLPQVSRDTCSGTASIWPLRRYTRHWDGKRGDDAASASVPVLVLIPAAGFNSQGCAGFNSELLELKPAQPSG